MMNSYFTTALLLGLGSTLIVAAVIDWRTFIISNKLNAAVAIAAPLFWWASGMAFWPGAAVQIGAAAVVLILLAGAFAIGMMGGGDVKLAAALALWFPPGATLHFLLWMSLAGGLLTLGLMVAHRVRHLPGRPEIPYGVAIAIGAWVILGQRFLNQFA
jgi:prepilin peptidase CpaA